jgi:hypothetical protein
VEILYGAPAKRRGETKLAIEVFFILLQTERGKN